MASGSTFSPTAAEFNPATTVTSEVLDATFVTRNPPDISTEAAVVGLCAVPLDRAGADDLGWHIADFLAFKALATKIASPDGQSWLSLCDISDVVAKDPDAYAHGDGPDRKDVSVAAHDDNVPIITETSARKLMVQFLSAIMKRSQDAKDLGYPLVIIICGLTTLEQDVYFGDAGYELSVTSEQIRAALPPLIESVTVITPSITSAGWQVNPSFEARPAASSRQPSLSFMARQCGAVFAQPVIDHYLQWNSPLIKTSVVDPQVRARESFPGPYKLSDEQLEARAALENRLHAALAARLMQDHENHSFSFVTERDDWVALIGPRQGFSLDKLSALWKELKDAPMAEKKRYCFLGGAFGGSKTSQVNHIKHLIKESFPSWPGYWSSTFNQQVRKEFEDFMKVTQDELEWHGMFNVMEQRMTLMVVADHMVSYAGLEPVWNTRCRDWDHVNFGNRATPEEKRIALNAFGQIRLSMHYVRMPHGLNRSSARKHQELVHRTADYIAAALALRYRGDDPSRVEAAIGSIANYIRQIQNRQIQMLMDDESLRATGLTWVQSINMPPSDRLITAGTAKDAHQADTTQTPSLAPKVEITSPSPAGHVTGVDPFSDDRVDENVHPTRRGMNASRVASTGDYARDFAARAAHHSVTVSHPHAERQLPPHLRSTPPRPQDLSGPTTRDMPGSVPRDLPSPASRGLPAPLELPLPRVLPALGSRASPFPGNMPAPRATGTTQPAPVVNTPPETPAKNKEEPRVRKTPPHLRRTPPRLRRATNPTPQGRKTPPHLRLRFH